MSIGKKGSRSVTIDNGFLRTALALSASLQNVTDNAGNTSTAYISTTNFNNRGNGNTSGNTVIGEDTFTNSTIGETIVIGAAALTSATSGRRSVIIGPFAGFSSTYMEQSVIIGRATLNSATSSDKNTIIGATTMQKTSGDYNAMVGYGHLYGFGWSTLTGNNYNSILGTNCHRDNLSPIQNCILIGTNCNAVGDKSMNIGNALYGININNGGYGAPGLNPQFAIGKVTPHASAILDLNSTTTRGFIPPNMSTAQRNLIASPANSLTVFDTDLDTICFYSALAGGWRQVSNSPA